MRFVFRTDENLRQFNQEERTQKLCEMLRLNQNLK